MLTEKQRAYIRGARRRWNVKVGATRSGKTWVDMAYMIPRRVMDAPEGGLIVLMGNTAETVARNVLMPMRRLYGAGLVGHPRVGNSGIRLFGREAYILGADTRDRVKAIQGAGFAYCYGDEITTWSRDVFEMVKSRLDMPESRFDGTCNPAGPRHWFKAFLESGADIFQQAYTIDDNPYLPEKFIRDLKAEYAGTVRYDRYILGRWTRAEGLVYRSFDEGRHVIERPCGGMGRIWFGADIGHVNATAFVALGQEPGGRLVVLAEYYHAGRTGGGAKSPLAYAQDFAGFSARVMGMYPDATYGGVYVDPSAAGFIAQLREVGVRRVYRARNDVMMGIARVASAFEAGRLVVCRGCEHTRTELLGYAWDDAAADRGEDRPVKVDDHCMDALRYGMMATGR